MKGLVIHVMATHDTAPWIRSKMRVLRKNPEPRRGNASARILRSRGVGKHNALRPRHGQLTTMPCTRQLAQAGYQNSQVSRPDPWSLALPHDDRAVIEIGILDPQFTIPPLIRPFHTEAGANKRCSPSRKPGMRHFIQRSAPPASATTAEVFRSPEAGRIRAGTLP